MKTETVYSVDLHTESKTVKVQAVDCGEWHPPTATSDPWGFLAIRLKSTFWSYTFRHRILGKDVLDILNQIDNRAPVIETDEAKDIIAFVLGCIKSHRNSGIALSRVPATVS